MQNNLKHVVMELQLRLGFEDNSEIDFLISQLNIHSDDSLELSQ